MKQHEGQSAKDAFDALASAAMAGQHIITRQLIVAADGQSVTTEMRLDSISDGKRKLLRSSFIDITDRDLAEAVSKRAESVFRFANEGIIVVTPDGTIVDVNAAFTDITGYSREDAIGKNPRFLQSGRHSPEFYENMWASIKETGRWSGEVWNNRKNGEMMAEMLGISAVTDDRGRLINYIGVFSDITAAKQHEAQLEHVAHYDTLTNLPNRKLLVDRLSLAIEQNRRNDCPLAVAFLDLDGFKDINDTFGHHIGDEVLISAAQRMKAMLRSGDTLARIGGDEFVAIIMGQNKAESYEPVVTRLLKAARESAEISGRIIQVTASVGVAIFPKDGTDTDQLIRHADQAMYEAKRVGKNRYFFYDPTRDAMHEFRSALVEAAGKSLE